MTTDLVLLRAAGLRPHAALRHDGRLTMICSLTSVPSLSGADRIWAAAPSVAPEDVVWTIYPLPPSLKTIVKAHMVQQLSDRLAGCHGGRGRWLGPWR
jgi:hypothetical protein